MGAVVKLRKTKRDRIRDMIDNFDRRDLDGQRGVAIVTTGMVGDRRETTIDYSCEDPAELIYALWSALNILSKGEESL